MRNFPSLPVIAVATVSPDEWTVSLAFATGSLPERFTTVPFIPPGRPCARVERGKNTASTIVNNSLLVIVLFAYYDISWIVVTISADERSV